MDQRWWRQKERVKKGKLFFVYTILFYWPATLITAVAPRRKEGAAAVHATRRRKKGPRGWTGGGGIFQVRLKKGK